MSEATGRGEGHVILDSSEIDRALTRMAHQIVESNHGAEGLVLLGIRTRGVPLAERLKAKLDQIEQADVPIGTLDITMYRDDLRTNPTRPVGRTEVPDSLEGTIIVLVDDVLFSGRTIVAALDALKDLTGRPAAVRLAVLIDRGHREFPISADVVGRELATSRDERVSVRLTEIDDRDEVSISRESTR